MEPINVLQEQGVPTDSLIKSVHFLKRQTLKTCREYSEFVKDLTEVSITFDCNLTAKYTILYLVQHIIQHSKTLEPLTEHHLSELVQASRTTAAEYIQKNQWVFAESETFDMHGFGKPHKISNKQIALEIVADNPGMETKYLVSLIQKETNLAKAGIYALITAAKKLLAT